MDKINGLDVKLKIKYALDLVSLGELDKTASVLDGFEANENSGKTSQLEDFFLNFSDYHPLVLFYVANLVLDDSGSFSLMKKIVAGLDPVVNLDEIKVLYSVATGWNHRIPRNEFLTKGLFNKIFSLRHHLESKVLDLDSPWENWLCENKTMLKKDKDPACKHVLLCVSWIGASHSSNFFNFVKNRVILLLSAGFEVKIFFCEEDFLSFPFLKNRCYRESEVFFHKKYWLDLTGNSPIFLSDLNFPDRAFSSSSHNFLYKLAKEDPDLVFFLGRGRSRISSVFCCIAHKKYPVGIFPTTSSQLPTMCCDGVVSEVKSYSERLETKSNGKSVGFYVNMSFDIPSDDSDFPQQDISWGSSAFVLVTPLTGKRLLSVFSRLDSSYLNELERFFIKHDDAIWLLVGVPDDIYAELVVSHPFLERLRSSNRIFNIGYTKYLRGLYRVCDIYFSPPGMGGGGGGAILATKEGLPVVTHKNGDSTIAASERLIYATPSSMYDALDSICSEPDVSQLSVDVAKKLLEKEQFDISSDVMRDSVCEIHMRGQRRLCLSQSDNNQLSVFSWIGKFSITPYGFK